MSRLDSAIRRLQAQRACLDQAAERIADLPGPVLELGLGNGRTYDHLRGLMPGRDIFVFEREVAAHPDCIPPDDHLILGDFWETLPAALDRFEGKVVLLHGDIGCGSSPRDVRNAGFVADLLPRLLTKGGIAIGDQDMMADGLEALALPEVVAPGRYFMYRRF